MANNNVDATVSHSCSSSVQLVDHRLHCCCDAGGLRNNSIQFDTCTALIHEVVDSEPYDDRPNMRCEAEIEGALQAKENVLNGIPTG
jgi:hypothetical protein